MSRTIRRKNCDWKKYNYVDAWVEDPESLAILTGERKIWGFRLCGKYRGCTTEQVRAKLNAWWHGEVQKNWDRNPQKKEFCRSYLRNKNKMELIQAIQRGEEEDLLPTERREAAGIFWYYHS